MAQLSCRVPDDLHDTLEAAADEAGLFRSDVIRRAVIHYIVTNPQEYQAFADADVPAGFRVNTPETTDGPLSSGSVYDPSRDL